MHRCFEGMANGWRERGRGQQKGVDKPRQRERGRVRLHQRLGVVGQLILEEYLSNQNRSVNPLLLLVAVVVVECDVELNDCDILKVNLFEYESELTEGGD